jgi:hypothetical protein
MTRLLITGSRTWDDVKRMEFVIVALAGLNNNDLVIVDGACPTGADRIAEILAGKHGLRNEKYPADWSKGRGAGFIRNQQMVDTMPDYCYAFIRNNSKGATHCANAAKKAGIPTVIFRMD